MSDKSNRNSMTAFPTATIASSPVKTARSLLRLALLLGAAVFLSSNVARASYHLWDVNEVYSSADGTVQFIELRALAGGQQNLGSFSATIRSTNSSGINVFTFPTNLPGDTTSKTCILGTSNLTSVPGGVVPCYIVP